MALRRWLWLLIIGFIAFIIGFMMWANTPLGPMPEASAALINGDGVLVDQSRWIVFIPENTTPETGFILYPGGRIDPRSYAPLGRAIAALGYQVVIVPMPLNLAVFGQDQAGLVISSYPEVEQWAIGGHSLGGSMAADYALKNLQNIKALVLLASYPAQDADLPPPLVAASIYGSLDGLLASDAIESSRRLMPEHTHWIEIEGGNHAQFGWYGTQPRDNPATISRQTQQDRTVEAIIEILAEISQVK